MAVAALGLSACTGEKLVPDNGNADGKFVTVHFGAEAAIEGATKATLTPNEAETMFASAWVNGDVLSVKYSFDYGAAKETTATWSAEKSCFEAQMDGGKGDWTYDALYPAPNAEKKVDFGSARTQNGSAYNSKFDLMKGSATAENADAGKTAEGGNIVFNMTRQTAIAYFHFTSTLDEEVVSAKLSVEGATAYLSTSEVKANEDYAKGYAFTKTEGVASKEINLTFDAGTAPKTSDFKLWFNVLPTDYDKMTLTVETANHTLTISRNAKAADKYEAGKLYKVVKDIPADKWVAKGGETPVASSYKIEFNNKSKQVAKVNVNTKASTFVITGTEYLEAQPFSNPSNAYYGGNETNGLPLRIGKKDASGSITMALSKAGQVNANKIILSAKQFTEDKTFAIGVNGSAKQQPGVDYTVLEFPLDGSPLTSIKLDSDGYIFIQSITVVSGPVDNTIPSLSVDQTSKVWAADATDAFVVKVTVNLEGGDWTVTPETLSWATIVVDKTAGTITVTPNGANTAQTANEATLTVTHASDASLKKEITLKQNAAAATANDGSLEHPYTAAEAIAAIDANTDLKGKYVKGIVKEVVSHNSSYGSMVYNIESGGKTLKIFNGYDFGHAKFLGTDDLKVGDEVVVFGDLYKYNKVYELNTGNYLISINGETQIYRGLAVSGQKTAFTVGDAFEFGGKALQVWRGKEDADVTASATFSGYNMSTEGKQTVTVAVGEETVTYEINVRAAGGEAPKTYTLQFGKPHNINDDKIGSYAKTWDATRDGFTWTLANWNNNDNGWTCVKAGSNKAASVATITTKTTMPEAISTVTMTIDAITATYVNSIKLEVLSADGKTVKETISGTAKQGDCVFSITNPQKDCKYMITVDCKQNTAKNGKNGFVQVSKVVYTNN